MSVQSEKASKAPHTQPWSLVAGAGKTKATVSQCRSWDPHVYVVCDDGAQGYVPLDERSHAIAVACEAASKKMWIRYWGHDPSWGGGAGYIQGAKVSANDHQEL